MSENIVLSDLVENAVYRRTWLLYKALETSPIDDAIGLALAADGFVTGSPTVQSGADCPIQATADPPSGEEQPLEPATDAVEATITLSKSEAVRAQLPVDQRERFIERLAAGATNSELASEFGLSRKQVQGFRIGLARKGAKRRTRFEEKPQRTEEMRSASAEELIGFEGNAQSPEETCLASPDEIIRYLRQQDDIVVRQGERKFLVNGRFHLALPELIERANKMRNRQGKPGFKCG